ncbi:DUF2807 domain-containing protein [Pedobacter sp. JY14-1]|uniref:GIN domain-containing protein n=1 Tax=Pedobacter sp. JY14-1 TaxID=3034151 RepID=UPI0023E13250|nr:DUF2807 domain-containing protein [Pedobacter sp. JY14-1]
MKTFTKSLIATAFSAVILGSTALASFAGTPVKPAIENEAAAVTFNKITVTGNVKVVLVQKDKESVSVDNSFNAEKTSIKRQGYNLLIHSSEINPVTVTVAVKDLQRIDVAGISSVETKGKLDVKYLQIFVSYSATAKINANTESLYTVISDAADLKLSGSAEEHTFVAGAATKADLKDFTVKRSERLSGEALAALSVRNAITAKAK